MDFRILGPIDVRNETGTVALAAKPRAVLAVLLLHANESVSAERLALSLWGEDAPGGAVKTVQIHVSRLRKALGEPGVIATTPAGYQLRVGAEELDADRFERLVDAGRDALDGGRPDQASEILHTALALWRGAPLADLAGEPFAAAEIARLEEERLAAIATRVDADLALGRHGSLVPELQRLVTENPLHERLTEQLMLALYRCGRQADALEAYTRARRALISQIGVEPGPQLRRMQELILRQDVSLQPITVVVALPPELEAAAALRLAGRDDERAWIEAHWKRARDGAGAVVTVVGPNGIGKTRLVADVATACHRAGATVMYVAGGSPADAVLGALGRVIGAGRPTLVVVDDADRGDARLAEALDELARELAASPVLVVATAADAGALPRVGADRALVLGPLHLRAVATIAREYAHAADRERVPTESLLAASGGIPRRVHEAASRWARMEASRRVGAAASRAAAGRAELNTIEEELAGDLFELQVVGERAARRARQEALVVCPFKGLASFDVADAPYFYGRDRLTAQLVAGLVGHRLLAIVGSSGSGKSSAMRAGLLPALAGGVLPGSDGRRSTIVRPGAHPMRELPETLRGGGDGTLVLAVDQFEETFTTCDDEDERTAFVDALVAAAHDRDGGCLVVLALRADYYGRCAAYPGLARMLAANHVLVGPMRREELRRAIEGPAEHVGLRVDGELTDALLRDVDGEPGALPLLSTALLELWQRREGRRLTHASYERTGGVRGAVSRLAEDAWGQLSEEQRRLARGVIMRLVGEGAAGGVERRRVALEDLETLRSEDVGRLVALLTDRRLLIVGAGAVELAHEALLREWPRLRTWIDEDRDGLRVQRNIIAAAREWVRTERDDAGLYRGARLAEALEWSAASPHGLNDSEHEFLAAGEAHRLRDLAARRRRVLLACSGAVTVLLAIGIGVVLAISSGRESRLQRDVSASVELAARSASTTATDPGLSRLLALAAYRRYPTREARAAVRQSVLADRATTIAPARMGALVGIAPSPDGRRVALVGERGSVQVWDPRSGRMVATIRRASGPPAAGPISRTVPAVGRASGQAAVAFSRDGRRIATVAQDGEVAISDADGRHHAVVLKLPTRAGPPRGVDVSPDGRTLVVVAGDGAVRLVDVARRTARVLGRHVNPGGAGYVTMARFNNSGTKVVSVGSPGGAKIWDVATGARTSLLIPGGGEAASASFSPDDRRVVAADEGGHLRIWDARTGEPLVVMEVSRAALTSVRYSADGRQVVTTGDDVAVYDADLRLLARFAGHVGGVNDATFVAGGAIASVGNDGVMRTWTPVTAIPMILKSGYSLDEKLDLRFSPDGRQVVWDNVIGRTLRWDVASGHQRPTGPHTSATLIQEAVEASRTVTVSYDGRLRVRDARTGRSRALPRVPPDARALAIDAAGRQVAVAGNGSGIRVGSADGGPLRRLQPHGSDVRALAFNRDGTQLAGASSDGTTSVFDVVTGRRLRILTGHAGAVTSVAYSADGTRVVTAGADATVRVSPVDGSPAVVLYGHVGAVNSAALDVAGDRVVTAGEDGTVRVWDAGGGETPIVVARYDRARAASFSPDGKRIVSAGDDVRGGRSIQVIACDVCGTFADVLRLAESRADRPLDAGARRQLQAGIR
jgi:WD40 repeat protein/DNA-binding SARP family transcriptional activator/energy-coupling factor transporter ATP-binding protein EcfA2